MQHLPVIMSIVFFVVCSFSLFLGLYTFAISADRKLGTAHLVLSLALGLWAFTLSISTSAPDYDTAYWWRNLSVLGWGVYFSVVLHYMWIWTGYWGRWSQARRLWVALSLYLPSALFIYIYLFSGLPGLTSLERSAFGWVTRDDGSLWGRMVNAYYLVCCGLFLGILLQVRRRNSDPAVRRQARLLFISSALALGVGFVTDVVLRMAVPGRVPQLGAILVAIPHVALYIGIRRYRKLWSDQDRDEELIADTGSLGIYNRLSLMALASAALNILGEYFLNGLRDLPGVLGFSGLLLLLGALIRLAGQLRLSSTGKLYMNVVLFSIVIVALTLYFHRDAALTVWSFPLALILFSLVFRRRILLVSFAAAAMLSQVILWLWVPDVQVEIKADEYVFRIGMISMFFVIAHYVHRTYVHRLRKNERQLQLQTMLTGISSDFAAAGRGRIDEVATRTLEQLGRHFELNRIVIFRADREDGGASFLWEWTRNGVMPLKPFVPYLPQQRLRWWMERMNEGDVAIYDVSELPDEPTLRKEELLKEGTASVAMLPLAGQRDWNGCMGLASAKPGLLQDGAADFFTIIANLFSEALKRMDNEREVDQLAFYDYLTKLPNRILFRRKADEALAQAKARGAMVAVLFIDLDLFKNINDTLGHEAGDELLVNVARAMRGALGRSCTLSRFGGDEFLVLAGGIRGKSEAIAVADRLMEAFRHPIRILEQEFLITASAGVALYPQDGTDTETLVKNADIAMYSAKESGKNQYRFCSAEMKEEVSERLNLANSLSRALEQEELRLVYQPQVSLHTGRIIGVEALIRWDRPEGSVPPQVFIPIAENTGYINPIGDWVLRTACAQNKAWQDKGLARVRMAVNVSVHQLRDPDFAAKLEALLAATGLDPDDLELEITESGAIREQDHIVQVLAEIKRKGVSISIDDFGTEYSSLSRLKQLPVDRIKLDMEFVHGIEGSPKDQAIAKIMISLARNLGLKVIAEGVETQGQLDFLSRRMCDEVQGFYYYHPLSAEEMEEVLRTARVEGAAPEGGFTGLE